MWQTETLKPLFQCMRERYKIPITQSLWTQSPAKQLVVRFLPDRRQRTTIWNNFKQVGHIVDHLERLHIWNVIDHRLCAKRDIGVQAPQNAHYTFAVSEVLKCQKSGQNRLERRDKDRLSILQNFAHSEVAFYLCRFVIVGYDRDFVVELLKSFHDVQSDYFCAAVNGKPGMNYDSLLHYPTLRYLRLSLRDRIYVLTDTVGYELSFFLANPLVVPKEERVPHDHPRIAQVPHHPVRQLLHHRLFSHVTCHDGTRFYSRLLHDANQVLSLERRGGTDGYWIAEVN